MSDAFKPSYVNDLVTPVGFLDFPQLWRPDVKGRTKFSKDAYGATLLFPKAELQTGLAPLRSAIVALAAKAFPGVPAGQWKHFLKDGDAPPGFGQKAKPDYYKGMVYLNASHTSKSPVRLVNRDKSDLNEVQHKDLLHRGSKVRCVVSIGTYVLDGKPGICCYLDVVQFVAMGERWGGGNVGALDELPPDEGASLASLGGGADPLAMQGGATFNAAAPTLAQQPPAAAAPARDPLL